MALKSDNIKKHIAAEPSWWTGRIDGRSAAHLRWHQWVKPIDLIALANLPSNGAVVLLGFACDEGVRRNKGRQGAAQGPKHLRRALANLPVFPQMKKIYDLGDVICIDQELEQAQNHLSTLITKILHSGNFPLLLGGGHEITYAHYMGLRQYVNLGTSSLGIVNFDAHFDLRKPDESGVNSGTGFWQIAQDCKKNKEAFSYLVFGIQKVSNTTHLFETAKQLNVRYISADDFHEGNAQEINALLASFISKNDYLYLTIDMDVFAAPFSPGVSAPAYNGIYPSPLFFRHLRQMLESKKVIGIDLSEVNPLYDIDSRTAKLAASFIYEVIERLSES